MTASTQTAPEITREQVQAVLVKPLAAASIFLAAGPRIFDSASPVRIPKLGGPTSPDWIGENEQITEKDVSFDELHLLPSTMKSVKVITRYSNELARQSVVSLDAALACAPDHVSAYALIVEEGTALARQVRRGEVPMSLTT